MSCRMSTVAVIANSGLTLQARTPRPCTRPSAARSRGRARPVRRSARACRLEVDAGRDLQLRQQVGEAQLRRRLVDDRAPSPPRASGRRGRSPSARSAGRPCPAWRSAAGRRGSWRRGCSSPRTWAGCRANTSERRPAPTAGRGPRRASPQCDCSPPRIRGYRPLPVPSRGSAHASACSSPSPSRRGRAARGGRRSRRAGAAVAGVGADRRLAPARRQPASRRSRSGWRRAGTPTGGCPASAGIPPSFDWSGSQQPRLRRLRVAAAGGLRQLRADGRFGYDGPAGAAGAADARAIPTAPLELALALDFGVCADICVPAEARDRPDRRRRTRRPPAGRAIEAALAERARSAAEAGVARVTCALAAERRRLRS